MATVPELETHKPFKTIEWRRLPFCLPYGGRQGGILCHRLEQGLLTTDDQPHATTARLWGKSR